MRAGLGFVWSSFRLMFAVPFGLLQGVAMQVLGKLEMRPPTDRLTDQPTSPLAKLSPEPGLKGKHRIPLPELEKNS